MPDLVSAVLTDAATGDDIAVAELYRSSISSLTSFVDRRGAEDPEHTASIAFERTVRHLPNFATEPTSVYWAYLYRTARNLVIDENRRRSRRPQTVLTAPEKLLDHAAPDAPFDLAISDNALVSELLGSLTDAQRKVIEHRFLEDLTIEHTATQTDMSVDAVKGMQRRAILAMRAVLAATTAAALEIPAVQIPDIGGSSF